MSERIQRTTATDDVNNANESQDAVEEFRKKGDFCPETGDLAADDEQHVTVATGAAPTAPDASSAAVMDGGTFAVPEEPASAVAEGGERQDIVPKRLESDFAVSGTELGLGLGSLALWFVLFTGGILISSQPYRDLVANSTVMTEWLSAYAMTVLFWTVTNVGLLTCLAALIGAAGYRTRFAHHNSHEDLLKDPLHRSTLPFDNVHYVSAIMRGFGIYALSFTGLLVLATDALQNPGQGDYLRLAATMTIVGFYAGYDPATFAGLLGRVKTFFEVK